MIPTSNIISPFSIVKEFRGAGAPGVKLKIWLGPSEFTQGGNWHATESFLFTPSSLGKSGGSNKVIDFRFGANGRYPPSTPNPDLGSPVLATGSGTRVVRDGANLNDFFDDTIHISDYLNHAFWSGPNNPSGLPAYDETDQTWFFPHRGTEDSSGVHWRFTFSSWDSILLLNLVKVQILVMMLMPIGLMVKFFKEIIIVFIKIIHYSQLVI